MWKLLCESVEGTSHRKGGLPCQDSTFATPFFLAADSGVILACADGAGSASESKAGSELACRLVVDQAMSFLRDDRRVSDIDDAHLRAWVVEVHSRLASEAERLAVVPRELACTLLIAVVGQESAAFAQVGDGAIVVLQDGAYRHVFWPQTGEYHNTTIFVTDAGCAANVQCARLEQPVTELSLMSDGLQMLALDYAAKSVHQGFFRDLFRSLRAAEDHHDLVVPMRQWLDSDSVNRRTDDDKTLILATREPTGGADAVV